MTTSRQSRVRSGLFLTAALPGLLVAADCRQREVCEDVVGPCLALRVTGPSAPGMYDELRTALEEREAFVAEEGNVLLDLPIARLEAKGAARDDDIGRAMVALSANPNDKDAEKIVSTDRTYHSMLRTTCVATLLEGGHANNALPQRAAANVNCRMFPGRTVEETQAALARAINDPKVTITPVPPIRPVAKCRLMMALTLSVPCPL